MSDGREQELYETFAERRDDLEAKCASDAESVDQTLLGQLHAYRDVVRYLERNGFGPESDTDDHPDDYEIHPQ